MVNESVYLDLFLISDKPGFLTVVLPERMQLIDKKIARWAQGPGSFMEYRRQIFDVLQHKVAEDQIK